MTFEMLLSSLLRASSCRALGRTAPAQQHWQARVPAFSEGATTWHEPPGA
jgi:hypothetical protein